MNIPRTVIASGIALLVSLGVCGAAAAQGAPAEKAPKAVVDEMKTNVGDIL
jgi:hypothetical protein